MPVKKGQVRKPKLTPMPTLAIAWTDADYYTDAIPMEWFVSEGYTPARKHGWTDYEGLKFCTCSVTVYRDYAILDYEVHDQENQRIDIDVEPGQFLIEFTDETRTKHKRILWRDGFSSEPIKTTTLVD
jgi:hypothetical protein